MLTLLVHLGYLGYDCVAKEAFIPNKEIGWEFENAIRVGGWQEAASILTYNDENSMGCAIKEMMV